MRRTTIILAAARASAPRRLRARRGHPPRIQCVLVLAAVRASRAREPEPVSTFARRRPGHRATPSQPAAQVVVHVGSCFAAEDDRWRDRRSAAAAGVSAAAGGLAAVEEDAAVRSGLVLVSGRRRPRLPVHPGLEPALFHDHRGRDDASGRAAADAVDDRRAHSRPAELEPRRAEDQPSRCRVDGGGVVVLARPGTRERAAVGVVGWGGGDA